MKTQPLSKNTDHLRVEHYLQELLPQTDARLHRAMRYSVLNGGKRLRPQLVYVAGLSFGCSLTQLDPAAAAIELLHCYSLIHDDLPAMDDDDMRRDQPSCHIQFDEATAILAGDALLGLAFSAVNHSQQVQILAHANAQMVLGQSLDLQFTSAHMQLEHINTIHLTKTAALFEAAILLAASLTSCSPEQYTQCQQLGQTLGLAFQIQDDLLDHQDDEPHLPTYPNAIGIEKSQQILKQHVQECYAILSRLPSDTSLLADLINDCIKIKQ